MPVLARKIARAKWEPKPELAEGEIAADAVTADLKTSGNALSFWRCSSAAAEDLKRAVLALAAAADRPDRLDVIYLDEQAVLMGGSGPGTRRGIRRSRVCMDTTWTSRSWTLSASAWLPG